MSEKGRKDLAANPRFWAWLCYELLNGTDGEPLRLQWFHVEMLKEMFTGGKLVINLPTDHSKSNIGCFVFPLLSLMANPNETHIICGANINDSKRRVHALQLEIETNKRLVALYPWIAKPEERTGIWSTIAMNVNGRTVNKPNPSVLAGAVGSSDIRGRRGKLIMDDIEGQKHKESATAREQLYDFVKLEAIRCFESPNESKRPLLCCLGTPFTVDSLYFKLEAEGWHCIRYAVLKPGIDAGARDGKSIQPRHLLWPEKVGKVRDARGSMDWKQFSIAYLMDPTGGDRTAMSFMQIVELMKQGLDQPRTAFFVSLDPAAGGNTRRSDYSGISVNEISWVKGDKLPKVRVHRAFKFTEGLFEQVHLCASLSAEYDCPVIYEDNAMQGGTYLNAFRHLHPETPLIRHHTTQGNKFDVDMGLTVLRTLLREQLMVCPEDQLESDGMRALITEIRDLGSIGANDHIACSVWFVIRHMYSKARIVMMPKMISGYKPIAWGFGGRRVG